MNRLVLAMVFAVSLMPSGTAQHSGREHIVLPNSKLIGCKASGCSQLWQDAPGDASAIYPHNLSIDIEKDAILGIVAHYDKSASYDDIKAAIDDRYSKWIYIDTGSQVKVWRVAPEKIAIQLP